MGIAHLSFSDTGGAGGVASRLAEIQRRRGHDAYVVSAISGSLRDAPFSKPLHTAAAVWDERVVRSPSFPAPISLARDALDGAVSRQLSSADIIHVHWPNGLISLEALAGLAGARPVVWTLHDMNAFTAVCHYSLGCRGFTNGCSDCPAVRPAFHGATSLNLTKKQNALSQFQDLRLVSPSSWLATEAAASQLLSGRPVTTIPNPLPEQEKSHLKQDEARRELGISNEVKAVFSLSASHLADPLKRAREATAAFVEVFSGRSDVQLIVSGRGELPPHPLVRQMGYVGSDLSHTIFSASDYLIVPSLAENQPLVIVEAQAAGASVIAKDSTGLPEHLDIDPTGRLFSTSESLAEVLLDAAGSLPTAQQRASLSKKARKKFSADVAADAYEKVYGI